MFVGSVAFAGITVAGQGSVKFNLLKGVKVGTDEKGENRGQITLFDGIYPTTMFGLLVKRQTVSPVVK